MTMSNKIPRDPTCPDASRTQILKLIEVHMAEEEKILRAAYSKASDELEPDWFFRNQSAKVPSAEDLTRHVGTIKVTFARIDLLRELIEEING